MFPVTVKSCGASDHNLVGYTRYSRESKGPPKTIRKRSYKSFVIKDFLNDLQKVNWSNVYLTLDVDESTRTLTALFREVLDRHAPWVVFQQRKKFAPWITKETESLMKVRDNLKSDVVKLTQQGGDVSLAWTNYKKVRNQINNRRKYEERKFKLEKVKSSLGSITDTWRTAKNFMGWEKNSGVPTQLNVNGALLTKSGDIANAINHFFIDKVKKIRLGITHVANTFTHCSQIMKKKSAHFPLVMCLL